MIEHESQIVHGGDNGNEEKQVVSHTVHDSETVKGGVIVNKGITGINTKITRIKNKSYFTRFTIR